MNLRRNLFIALSLTVLLTACGSKGDQAIHFSNEGLIPEAYLPADVGLLVSYSTRSDEQFTAIQALESSLGDEDRISETASETLDKELGAMGLDFERDLKPAFGERFRMIYALRATEDDPENFTVITLEEPSKMRDVLQTLSDAEQLSYKKLSDIEAYISKDSTVYLTVYEDLLFVTSNAENLVAMTEQEEETSLWEVELYQETVEEVGVDYTVFGVMYPSLYSQDLSLLAGFSVSDIPSVVDRQVVVVRAEAEGLRFDAWMNANKSKAKEAGISFDSVPREEPYLFEEIPADGLLAYFESYGLAQTFAQAEAVGDDTQSLEQLKEVVRNYFGMDLEDLMSFLDKGYSIALHGNGGNAIPGITVFIDTSSNPETADDFVNKLDGQLSGLMALAEQFMPGALTKDTVKRGEDTFSRLTLDLSSLATEGSAVPTAITADAIELVYGIQNDRLVISTLSDWNSEGETIAESTLYQDLNAQLMEQNQGLILIDAHGLSSYLEQLRSISGELDAESETQLDSVEAFLEGFLGLMAQSQTDKYESHFGGFLMLAE
ncbi:MAG: DUF3352 domain-containing protein [Patescibacteria group bacterium]